MLDESNSQNVGPFCCSKKNSEHQNGSRATLLGYLTPNEYAQNCKCIHNSKTLK